MTRLFTGAAAAALTAFALLCTAPPAHAQTGFDGAAMTLFFDDPTLGAHIDTRNFTVVGPTAVEARNVLGFMNVDVQAQRFVLSTSLTGTTIGSLPVNPFSGFTLFDSGNTLPNITGARINPNSNLTGFNAGRLTFDANNVFVNLQGLSLGQNTRLEVDVTFEGGLPTQTFVGAPMTLFYDDPTLGSHIDTRNFTVTGIEAERVLGFLNVDVSSSQIELTTTLGSGTTASLPASAFSGFNLRDAAGGVSAITGVSINPNSSFVGFGAGRLSFDADNVFVNLAGLTFREDTRLLLDVTFAPVTAAPEPAPAALMAAVLGGVAIRARRRGRFISPRGRP